MLHRHLLSKATIGGNPFRCPPGNSSHLATVAGLAGVSFDHLVGAGDQRLGDRQAKSLGDLTPGNVPIGDTFFHDLGHEEWFPPSRLSPAIKGNPSCAAS